jgi:hypothetical protein
MPDHIITLTDEQFNVLLEVLAQAQDDADYSDMEAFGHKDRTDSSQWARVETLLKLLKDGA